MRVPLAWLREYVDLPADPHRVAEMLAQIGFPVEAIEQRPVVTGVVSGRIEELEKHPNADRLQVGKINVGNGALLTIATAATNVAQGQTIPVATIGAQLPHLKIERRKMRGVESEGMMVSADELALPPDWFEDGIMQLESGFPLGEDVVEYFRLSEAVLEVEITGNRADAMSIFGLARELAAYQGTALRLPQTAQTWPDAPPSAPAPKLDVETPDCKFFIAQDFENVRVGPSPAWMRIRLALAGQRPINNLVDVSNYVMLETGQPLHFYDAAKIPNRHLIVRDAREGERLITLDGEEHDLAVKDLTIASENGPEGLAGLMGGASSEVTGSTTSILLESATFTGSRVRRTSQRLGFRTEASSRHEKSLSPYLAEMGARRASDLLVAMGASQGAAAIVGTQAQSPAIEFDVRDVKRLLGYELTLEEIREYLDRLGFKAEPQGGGTLSVLAPPWRTDIALPADIIEEIARMAGYDRIESSIPAVAAHNVSSSDYQLESRIARSLAALGYNEIVTVALHGADVFERVRRAGFESTFSPVEVVNPLSEDQRYLRSALGPAQMEYFARIDAPARVFEIGHIFYMEDGQPQELPMVAFGFTAAPGNDPDWRDSHFLRLKSDLEALLHALTGRRDFEFTPDERNALHPGKTAAILLDGREIAYMGQTDPRLTAAFDVRLPIYGAFIYLARVPEYTPPQYRAPSKYPSTYRDLALVSSTGVPAAAIERAIAAAIGSLCTGVRAFDEYRGPQVGEGQKSLAVRVTLQRTDATITDQEADAAIARALQALRDDMQVTLRA